MLFHGKFNPMPTVFHGGGHDRLVQVHDRGSKSQGNKQLYVVDCVEAWMLLHRQGMSFSTRVCPVCDCCLCWGHGYPPPSLQTIQYYSPRISQMFGLTNRWSSSEFCSPAGKCISFIKQEPWRGQQNIIKKPPRLLYIVFTLFHKFTIDFCCSGLGYADSSHQTAFRVLK